MGDCSDPNGHSVCQYVHLRQWTSHALVVEYLHILHHLAEFSERGVYSAWGDLESLRIWYSHTEMI